MMTEDHSGENNQQKKSLCFEIEKIKNGIFKKEGKE
jgi:hypothetical protein